MSKIQVCLGLVVLLILLVVKTASAAGLDNGYSIMQLDALDLTYHNYKWLSPDSRNPIIYPEHPKEGINVGLNFGLLNDHLYWNSEIQSLTTDSQYREIGLESHLGVHIGPVVDFGLWHHSQHVLDESQPVFSRYPSEDAVELKLHIYKR